MTFTASNGVVLNDEGFYYGGGDDNDPPGAQLITGIHEARKEYYQHLRDEELGRVRMTAHPDYVIYPDKITDEVMVIHETTGTWGQWNRNEAAYEAGSDDLANVADDYFLTQPEPRKPWHDAEVGEVWMLTLGSLWERPALVADPYLSGEKYFDVGEEQYLIRDSAISFARRIWPEAGA